MKAETQLVVVSWATKSGENRATRAGAGAGAELTGPDPVALLEAGGL